MSTDGFAEIGRAIEGDPSNAEMTQRGWAPLYTAAREARVAIVGQAPGRRAQASGVPWDDASGAVLMNWLGVDEADFRDPAKFTLLPMDFYYPGKGAHGDLPPRKDFADTWHPPLLALMPDIRLTVLIGNYAQKHYLPLTRRLTLTERVQGFREYGPAFFPVVHPSPLNFRWLAKNPWFVADVVPELRADVQAALE